MFFILGYGLFLILSNFMKLKGYPKHLKYDKIVSGLSDCYM